MIIDFSYNLTHRYQQSNVEDLILKEGDTTALSHVVSLYPGHKEQYLRNQLGLFGIRGATASQPMKTLSGESIPALK